MQFKDIPVGQTFHFCDDIMSRDHIKFSDDMAERDGICVKVRPDYCCQQWFIVFDSSCDSYIENIYFDGEINLTKDKALAQIFRGDAWEQFWQSVGCNLLKVTGTGVLINA